MPSRLYLSTECRQQSKPDGLSELTPKRQGVLRFSGPGNEKNVYYAMDSCYSGLGFTRGIGTRPSTENFVDIVTSRRAVQMMTAGQEREQALEQGGRGIFTSSLVRALEGEADFNGDGYVTASEIGAFVPSNVSSATHARQNPRHGTLEGSGEVVFPLE